MSKLVGALKALRLTYLSFLPGLAAAGLILSLPGELDNNFYGWLYFGGMFAVAFYLQLSVVMAEFPDKIWPALAVTFLVPLQVMLSSWLFGDSYWQFFINWFFVEVIGSIIGLLLFAGFFRIKWRELAGKLSDLPMVIIVAAIFLLALGVPIVLFYPVVIAARLNNWWSILFLLGAVAAEAVNSCRQMQDAHEYDERYWLILVGVVIYFLSGLAALFRGQVL